MTRFTETSKWRDPWFQALKHGEKLLFLYLIDNCNNAGFYEVNLPELCFHLGIDQAKYEAALRGLQRGIQAASGWLWIRNFLKHQKNDPLNADNPAHKQIIRLIKEQGSRFMLFPDYQVFLGRYKDLLGGIESLTGKGTGRGKGKKGGKGENKSDNGSQPIFATEVGAILGRSSSFAHWSEKERTRFRQISFVEEDVLLVARYYRECRKLPENYCRRDLETLLNNWHGEVDRARAYCEKNPLSATKTLKRVDLAPLPTDEERKENQAKMAPHLHELVEKLKSPHQKTNATNEN